MLSMGRMPQERPSVTVPSMACDMTFSLSQHHACAAPAQGGMATPAEGGAEVAASDRNLTAKSDQFSLRRSRQQGLRQPAFDTAELDGSGTASSPHVASETTTLAAAAAARRGPGSAPGSSSKAPGSSAAKRKPRVVVPPAQPVSQYKWDPTLDPASLAQKKDKLARTPPGGRKTASIFARGTGDKGKARESAAEARGAGEAGSGGAGGQGRGEGGVDGEGVKDAPKGCRCCVVQ